MANKSSFGVPLVIPIFLIFALVSGVYLYIALPLWARAATSSTALATASFSGKVVPPDDTTRRYNLDATWLVSMTKQYVTPNEASYTFFVTDIATGKKRQIFTRTIKGIGSMFLPFNSWSPDSTYVYVADVERGVEHILVLKTSGEDMLPGQKYLDVFEYFAKRNLGYTYKEVTGWASPTLLIVNTTMSDSPARGPSFWFEVTDQAFIELATRF